MSAKEREQLYAEFSILSTLKHPNIVGYFHREHLKNSQDLYIYMEYCGGGDLGTVIKNLKTTGEYAKEEFVWRMFAQIVAALYRCHYGIEPPEPGSDLSRQKDPRSGLKAKSQSIMILHRDLKPENSGYRRTLALHLLTCVVFLGEDQSVKLGDFGLSKLMQSHDFASTYVGTPFYMSPEICQAETYNMRSDIWSLGCIMYELCAKEPPFNAKTHIQLAQNIRKGVFKDLPSIYSRELQNVIASCLKVNPKFRPDAASLLTIPYVWIARKGLEMVETGKALKTREETAMQKLKQAEERLASLDRERETMRQQMEDTLRREWEVKARLEIDRQVEVEIKRLQKKFDQEVNERAHEVARNMTRTIEQRALRDLPNPPSAADKENVVPQSSVSASGEEDFPSTTDLTDLSALSLESPKTSSDKPPAARKSSKTPFSRSKTTFDSPADIQMGESSPMSISSLALSPRRNAAAQAAAAAGSKNIFTEAARQKATDKWEPTLAYTSDDDDDDIPELPSPTRPKLHARDPFKVPARPGLTRQATTATMQKLTTQPTLFPTSSNTTAAVKGATGSGIPRTVTEPDMRPSALTRSPSNRRLSKLPSSTNLAGDAGSPTRKPPSHLPSKIGGLPSKQAKEGGEEMIKAVVTRNMNVGTGRTLVELAQARAGGRPLSMDMGKGVRIAVDRMERELPPVPVWDPERDEMPSPFLTRTRRVI
jgi:NIMA (never in mitosis gene a)-related kinase 2